MFKQIDIKALKENPVHLLDDRWGLLSAGDENAYNMMTVSWGMLGELWGKPVCAVFVRPQRHTYGFTEKGDKFTLSFFPDEMKKALAFCGSKSGRDTDKVKETGLSVGFDDGYITYEQAQLVICCKKLYAQDIDKSCFVDKSIIDSCYALDDYHKMYICQIEKVLVK